MPSSKILALLPPPLPSRAELRPPRSRLLWANRRGRVGPNPNTLVRLTPPGASGAGEGRAGPTACPGLGAQNTARATAASDQRASTYNGSGPSALLALWTWQPAELRHVLRDEVSQTHARATGRSHGPPPARAELSRQSPPKALGGLLRSGGATALPGAAPINVPADPCSVPPAIEAGRVGTMSRSGPQARRRTYVRFAV